MTKRRPHFVCKVCDVVHNRHAAQSRFCSVGCQLLYYVAKDQREVASGCWEWTASSCGAGYGQLTSDGVHHKAHRLAYTVFKGAIEPGQSVCHACDNPSCINPSHLFLGTHAENMADMAMKQRSKRGQNHFNAALSDEDALALKSSEGTPAAVAKRFGVSVGTVHDIWSGRSRSYLPSRAVLCPHAAPLGDFKPKLSMEVAQRIRREHRPLVRGFGVKSLAKRYGVTPSTVSLVLRGKSYGAGQ